VKPGKENRSVASALASASVLGESSAEVDKMSQSAEEAVVVAGWSLVVELPLRELLATCA
jgi:hypothetical protein